MTAHSEIPGPNDPGLTALVMLLRFHGVGADPGQIRHHCGTAVLGVADMIRCAREFGVKARELKTSWARLATTPMPAIAVLRDGGFLLLGKVGEDKIVVQSTKTPRPELMTKEDLEGVRDGRIILMTKRSNLMELSRRFDITWFLGAIQKYSRQLTEVLVASFFLQLFALVSPLFFQVVIDKVLVHRGVSTLDVLILGLLGIGAFETILGILRTYLFSHTTNRIDVELGARLFQHLLALPTAYFQARRVGDFGGSGPRTGEYQDFPDQLRADTRDRSCFYLRFSRRHVCVFTPPDRDRPARFPFYIGISPGVTAFSANSTTSSARRRKSGVLGRKHHWNRNSQVDGGRTADAATLGRAAGSICGGKLSCPTAGEHRQQLCPTRQ